MCALPGTVPTGPLAIDAALYWRSSQAAAACARSGARAAAHGPIRALLDLSEAGHPLIRVRADRARFAAVQAFDTHEGLDHA